MDVYNVGRDALDDWESATYRALLMRTGAFDADQDTLADVVAGGTEVTTTGYSRFTLTTLNLTVNDSLDRSEYSADPIDFGSMTAGQNALAVVVYRFITDDAGSIPLGWQAFAGPPDTGDFDPFTITFPSGILFTKS